MSRRAVHHEEVWIARLAPFDRRGDQLAEERMRSIRTALELGMCLGADPERMTLELDELDESAVRRDAAAAQPRRFHPRLEVGVQLVAMAVTLGDGRLAVRRMHLRPRLEDREARAEALGAALVRDIALIVHQVDHRVWRRRIHLR